MHVMDKSFSNIKLNKKIKNSCQVLIISPGKGIYDYKVNNKIEIGQIVTVPLRKKFYQGIVLDRGTRGFPNSKLKDITEVHQSIVIPSELLSFCLWLSSWYMSDKSQVFKMVFPSATFLNAIKNTNILQFNKDSKSNTTKLGDKVIEYIKNNKNLSITECSKQTNVSYSVIKKLIKDDILIYKNINDFKTQTIKKEKFPKALMNEVE